MTENMQLREKHKPQTLQIIINLFISIFNFNLIKKKL